MFGRSATIEPSNSDKFSVGEKDDSKKNTNVNKDGRLSKINIGEASLLDYSLTDDTLLKYIFRDRNTRHYSHDSQTSYNTGK